MPRWLLCRWMLSVLILACLSAGCSSYVPPSLPEGGFAKLTPGDPDLKIKKIDGKSVAFGLRAGTTILAPGFHDIDVIFHRETAGEMLSTHVQQAECQLHLDAIASGDYTAKCLLVGYQMAFWIEETSTGQIAAGSKPELPQKVNSNIPTVTP